MPPVGFEPTISAGERPQTYALDRAATGTGIRNELDYINYILDPVRYEKTAFKLCTPKDDAIRNPNTTCT